MSKIGLILFAIVLGGCAVPKFPNTGTSSVEQGTQAIPVPPLLSVKNLGESKLLNPITVKMDSQSKSGESGSVLFQDYGDKTRVTITTSGGQNNVNQPAHIHSGVCPSPGEVLYSLNNVVNGTSDTLINVKMSDLFDGSSRAVNVHKSVEEIGIYKACGNLM